MSKRQVVTLPEGIGKEMRIAAIRKGVTLSAYLVNLYQEKGDVFPVTLTARRDERCRDVTVCNDRTSLVAMLNEFFAERSIDAEVE